MILAILQILFATYLVGVCIVVTLTGVAVWKIGGFQEFADRASVIGQPEGDPFTSNETQWMLVLITVFWPLVPVFIKWAAKTM